MFFTWMIAMNQWMVADPAADPFRMAEEEMGKILAWPVAPDSDSALPTDRKLVA